MTKHAKLIWSGFIISGTVKALRAWDSSAFLENDLILVPIYLLVVSLFISGIGLYAYSKGRSKWWGILGLTPPIGLLVVWLIPRKNQSIPSEKQRLAA